MCFTHSMEQEITTSAFSCTLRAQAGPPAPSTARFKGIDGKSHFISVLPGFESAQQFWELKSTLPIPSQSQKVLKVLSDPFQLLPEPKVPAGSCNHLPSARHSWTWDSLRFALPSHGTTILNKNSIRHQFSTERSLIFQPEMET